MRGIRERWQQWEEIIRNTNTSSNSIINANVLAISREIRMQSIRMQCADCRGTQIHSNPDQCKRCITMVKAKVSSKSSVRQFAHSRRKSEKVVSLVLLYICTRRIRILFPIPSTSFCHYCFRGRTFTPFRISLSASYSSKGT